MLLTFSSHPEFLLEDGLVVCTSAVRTRLLRVAFATPLNLETRGLWEQSKEFSNCSVLFILNLFALQESISASLLKMPGMCFVFRLTSDCLVSQAEIWSNTLPVGVCVVHF